MRRKRYRLETILAPGETLTGRHVYTVGALLGSGAFAHVYRGQADDGRAVAIKEFLAPTSADQASEIDRVFAHERRIMEALGTHPAFPDLIDALDCDGRHYLVQAFIAGETLEALLEKHGPYREDEITKWLLPLCEGVVHMHQAEIVHHDLKPANIKITPEDLPVVLDLGAAQVLGEEGAGFYGSDGYMPPEIKRMLAEGNLQAHKQTDVFALGCIIYELLLGTKPTQEDIDEHSGRLVGPLLRRLGDFHPGLVGVMTNAISFSQGYRYESAAQMLEDARRRCPASLWVNTTRLDFAGPAHSRLHESLALRNRGGGTMECNLSSRAPWLTLAAGGEELQSQLRVTGNEVTVQVWADTEGITERNVRHAGELLIKHELGEVTVECTLVVQARPAMAQAESHGVYLTVQAGERASATLGVRNSGEETGQFTARSALPAITVRPVAFTLDPMQTIALSLQVDASALREGSHNTVLHVSADSGHRLEVPVTVDVGGRSLLGGLTAKLRRKKTP